MTDRVSVMKFYWSEVQYDTANHRGTSKQDLWAAYLEFCQKHGLEPVEYDWLFRNLKAEMELQLRGEYRLTDKTGLASKSAVYVTYRPNPFGSIEMEQNPPPGATRPRWVRWLSLNSPKTE